MAGRPPDWTGATVVCVASGPSLNLDEVASLRGLPMVVTNASFRAAPWADILFGHDSRFWRSYIEEIRQTFQGRKIVRFPGKHAEFPDVEPTGPLPWFQLHSNSGSCAISIAIAAKASRVILLGYDAMKGDNGAAHWHQDHPKGMSNCASIAKWPHQFKMVARQAAAAGVEVINCSPRTALTCFVRKPLSEVACEVSEVARV